MSSAVVRLHRSFEALFTAYFKFVMQKVVKNIPKINACYLQIFAKVSPLNVSLTFSLATLTCANGWNIVTKMQRSLVLSSSLTRWYSRVTFQTPSEELIFGFRVCLLAALQKYYEVSTGNMHYINVFSVSTDFKVPWGKFWQYKIHLIWILIGTS